MRGEDATGVFFWMRRSYLNLIPIFAPSSPALPTPPNLATSRLWDVFAFDLNGCRLNSNHDPTVC